MNNTEITRISAKRPIFSGRIKELVKYRGLIILWVKRNFATRYKQTVLGSAWILINPICTTVMNIIVFGAIAKLDTDGIPTPIFYLLGNVIWWLFSGCLNDNANTFTGNAGLFGKVYFPRLVVPVANVMIKFIDFLIQASLLLVVTIVYCLLGFEWKINIAMLVVPFVLLQFALLGMGVGIIVSAFTTKYRDLQVLVGFGVTIWMYLTPIVYSVKEIPEKYLSVYMCNPVTPGMIIIKYAYLEVGNLPWKEWGVSCVVTVLICLAGILIFNKVESTFLDMV